jgi:serine/threonine protein kinase
MKDAIPSELYSSIELLDLEDAHTSYDIWSLGIIVYKLMAKKEPYAEQSNFIRSKAIKDNQREKLSESYS